MFIEQDNYPEWAVTVKSVSVIWGCSTGLYVLIMKILVSTKLSSSDQTSVYLKAAVFFLMTFLEWKSSLKIVGTYDSLCTLKV